MGKNYFHISAIKNREYISKNGLLASDGNIFLFDNIDQMKPIALNQIFLNSFDLWSVSSDGFNCILEQDNVGEIGWQHQWFLRQNVIESKYLNFLSEYNFKRIDLVEDVEYKKHKSLGLSEEKYIELIRYFPERIARYNELNNTRYEPLKIK